MKSELQLHFFNNLEYFINVLYLLEASLVWIKWIGFNLPGITRLFSEIFRKMAIFLEEKGKLSRKLIMGLWSK